LRRWIAANLSDRTQRVKTGNVTTERNKLESGVLCPILLILFIADINQYIPSGCNIMKYADDILAYVLGKCDVGLPQAIAKGVEDWCTANKMRLNEGKCKVLLINENKDSFPLITLSNKPLEVVSSYKYLGIEINTELNSTLI